MPRGSSGGGAASKLSPVFVQRADTGATDHEAGGYCLSLRSAKPAGDVGGCDVFRHPSFHCDGVHHGADDDDRNADSDCRLDIGAHQTIHFGLLALGAGESVGKLMRNAITRTGTKFASPGDDVPIFVETPANDEFGPVIRNVRIGNKLPRKVIGKIAGVSSETVKAWEKGRQIPHSENLFRMARTIPSVKRWTLRQLGVTEQPEFMSPQVMTAMMAAVNQVAHQPGPDGDAIRALLRGGQ